MESDESKKEIRLFIKHEGNKKWLCVKDGPYLAKVRMPLHVEKLDIATQEWHLRRLSIELRDKLQKRKAFKKVD